MAPATKRAAASSPSASSLLKEHGASSSSIDVVNGTPVRERKAARTGLPSVEGLSEKTYEKAAQGSISLTAEFIVRKVAAFPTNRSRLGSLGFVGKAATFRTINSAVKDILPCAAFIYVFSDRPSTEGNPVRAAFLS